MTNKVVPSDLDKNGDVSCGLFRCLSHRTRYLVLILGTVCLTSICSNMIIYNFTVICMDAEHEAPLNETKTPFSNRKFTHDEKTILYWAVGVGTLVAALPFNWLYVRFGARPVFFIAGALSLVATGLTPFVVNARFYWFVLARFVQGMAFGSDFAAIGLITVQWASTKQNAIFIAILTSFSQYAVIFTMPIAGVLCESSWGWPSVYYLHVAVGIPLFLLWLYFYRDDPKLHPTVSQLELSRIHHGKTQAHRNSELKIPLKAILTNWTVWSIWLCAFADLMVAQLFVLYGPTYLNKVLKFGVAETGYLMTLALIPYIFARIASGFASDMIKCIGEKTKMILFNTVSIMGCAILLIVLGFMDSTTAITAMILLVLVEASFGPTVGGFYKCAAIHTRQYNHFVLSCIQFTKCLALFVEPGLNLLIVSDQNRPIEWRIIFFLHSAVLVFSAIFFLIFVTDRPAKFAEENETDNLKKNDKEIEAMQNFS